MSLYQKFDPLDLTRDQAWELAVLLSTKGFKREHHFALFGWDKAQTEHVDVVLNHFGSNPDVQEAAEANGFSINQADGLAWLKAVLEIQPHYRGPVPMWTSFALCGAWEDAGMKDEPVVAGLGLAGAMGVGEAEAVRRCRYWRHQLEFEPLTGLAMQ